MLIGYLGLFDKIFSAIMNALLTPLRVFFVDILGAVATWFINDVFMDFLWPIVDALLTITRETLFRFFFELCYTAFVLVLSLIDAMQGIFDILIGIKPVYIEEALQSGTVLDKQQTLLNVLLGQDGIRTAFIAITVIAVALAMAAAIYSVIRSTLDVDGENRRPVAKVLRSLMKSMISFLMVPFIVMAGLYLSSALLQQTVLAIDTFAGNGSTSISSAVFGISASQAAISPDFNVIEQFNGKNMAYYDTISVHKYLLISKIDYFIGFIFSIFILIVLAMSVLVFIRRIFEVIMLFLISPYFVSSIVLDDGEKFARWRELFLAKVLGGYGAAISMRVYLMVCPLIMSDTIRFVDTQGTGLIANHLIKLIFLAGGAYAVYKSTGLLTSLFSASAAHDESSTAAMVGGYMIGSIQSGGQKLFNKGAGKMKQMAGRSMRGGKAGLGGKGGLMTSNRAASLANNNFSSFRGSKPSAVTLKNTAVLLAGAGGKGGAGMRANIGGFGSGSGAAEKSTAHGSAVEMGSGHGGAAETGHMYATASTGSVRGGTATAGSARGGTAGKSSVQTSAAPVGGVPRVGSAHGGAAAKGSTQSAAIPVGDAVKMSSAHGGAAAKGSTQSVAIPVGDAAKMSSTHSGTAAKSPVYSGAATVGGAALPRKSGGAGDPHFGGGTNRRTLPAEIDKLFEIHAPKTESSFFEGGAQSQPAIGLEQGDSAYGGANDSAYGGANDSAYGGANDSAYGGANDSAYGGANDSTYKGIDESVKAVYEEIQRQSMGVQPPSSINTPPVIPPATGMPPVMPPPAGMPPKRDNKQRRQDKRNESDKFN